MDICPEVITAKVKIKVFVRVRIYAASGGSSI